mmetsp:Transcript_886/g.3529  ORF Transcript_886/g.3529 Transcript_886/m.3529 type:complete len:180 (+) Transcript_886:753-1292(+)
MCMRVPSVIALRSYQHRNLATHPHFTRRNVYIRDLFTCQYCARQFRPSQLTYDHVVPRSKGGATAWENVVTACTACNNKKRDLPVATFTKKYGVKLKREPYTPSHGELAAKARRLPLYRHYHETWGAYVSDKTQPEAEGGDADASSKQQQQHRRSRSVASSAPLSAASTAAAPASPSEV